MGYCLNEISEILVKFIGYRTSKYNRPIVLTSALSVTPLLKQPSRQSGGFPPASMPRNTLERYTDDEKMKRNE
jgi:hypothetical protein